MRTSRPRPMWSSSEWNEHSDQNWALSPEIRTSTTGCRRSTRHCLTGHALKKGISPQDVRFEGRIDASAVPAAVAACDICVYPAPHTDHSYFMRDTSPLKLFEYLAAGRPVVCADLPPIRDVVDEGSAFFFRAGSSDDLAKVLAETLKNSADALARAHEGRDIVQKHSWQKRMERILEL